MLIFMMQRSKFCQIFLHVISDVNAFFRFRKVNESDALPPIMEAAPGDDGSENPWEKKERERKDRIGKQKKRYVASINKFLGPLKQSRVEKKAWWISNCTIVQKKTSLGVHHAEP